MLTTHCPAAQFLSNIDKQSEARKAELDAISVLDKAKHIHKLAAGVNRRTPVLDEVEEYAASIVRDLEVIRGDLGAES